MSAGSLSGDRTVESENDIVGELRGWALAVALPLWATVGFDARRGGFQERLDLKGGPELACPRRIMVQARQTYVYAHAAVLGWHRDGAEIALRGFDFMEACYRRADGAPGYVHSLAPDGGVADARRDTYDHAFVLLALAWVARATGEPRAHTLIEELLAFFDQHLATQDGSFLESIPAVLPRRQNPHMHVFEAMLALHETIGHPQALPRARALVRLLERTFIDPETRTIREYFDARWHPAPDMSGDHIEPGHHAEWVWLLRKYQQLSGEDMGPLTDSLFATPARFADAETGLLIDVADRFGQVITRTRRCWPQTEFAKAWMTLHESGHTGAADKARQILRALKRDYLSGPVPGAWYDRFDAEGKPDSAFVPASTFYHLFGVIAEADRVLGQPVSAA